MKPIWICAVFLLLATAGGSAQEPDRTTADFGAWQLRCETRPADDGDRRACEVGQNVRVQGQPQPLLQIAIGRTATDQPFNLVLRVPIAAWLPTGVDLVFGDDQVVASAEFKRCVANACIAEADAPESLIESIRQREPQQAAVTFRVDPDQPISVPIALAGFGNAVDALAAAETGR